MTAREAPSHSCFRALPCVVVLGVLALLLLLLAAFPDDPAAAMDSPLHGSRRLLDIPRNALERSASSKSVL